MAAGAPAPSRAVASASARSRSVSNGMAIICQIGIVRSARPARYSPSVAATAASVALSGRIARASGSLRILATRSARPTTNPACGPPTSLSPLNVTTSEPAARRSLGIGSWVSPKRAVSRSAPLPRSSTTIAPWRWASSATSRASGASTNPCWVKFDGCTRSTSRAPIGQWLLEVRGTSPIGRADLDQPRTGPADDLRDAHAAADLDQLAPADGHPAAARETHGERHGRRVVVRDERGSGTGQLHQRVLGGAVALAPPARLPVELEQQVGSRGPDGDGTCFLRPGRPPEVRVDDHAGRVDDRDEALAQPRSRARSAPRPPPERRHVAWRLARAGARSPSTTSLAASRSTVARPPRRLVRGRPPAPVRRSGAGDCRASPSILLAGAHGSRTHRATPGAAPLVLKTGGATGPQPPPRRW